MTRAIFILRGRRVLVDVEFAAPYGVTGERLNLQVRRNHQRFPADFLFRLTPDEFSALSLQDARTKQGRGGRRKLPLVFTEHGAVMAASVLNSPRAVEMTVYVMRTFVKLRRLLSSNRDLACELEALERSLVKLDLKTRSQFKEVYQAIPRPYERAGRQAPFHRFHSRSRSHELTVTRAGLSTEGRPPGAARWRLPKVDRTKIRGVAATGVSAASQLAVDCDEQPQVKSSGRARNREHGPLSDPERSYKLRRKPTRRPREEDRRMPID